MTRTESGQNMTMNVKIFSKVIKAQGRLLLPAKMEKQRPDFILLPEPTNVLDQVRETDSGQAMKGNDTREMREKKM